MDGYAFRSVLGSVPNGPCFSRVEHVERVEWLMKGRSRKVCGWLWMAICGANASMGHHGRKNYCGNLLWQSCLTLLDLYERLVIVW